MILIKHLHLQPSGNTWGCRRPKLADQTSAITIHGRQLTFRSFVVAAILCLWPEFGFSLGLARSEGSSKWVAICQCHSQWKEESESFPCTLFTLLGLTGQNIGVIEVNYGAENLFAQPADPRFRHQIGPLKVKKTLVQWTNAVYYHFIVAPEWTGEHLSVSKLISWCIYYV